MELIMIIVIMLNVKSQCIVHITFVNQFRLIEKQYFYILDYILLKCTSSGTASLCSLTKYLLNTVPSTNLETKHSRTYPKPRVNVEYDCHDTAVPHQRRERQTKQHFEII